jgi:hypothetical protein
LFSKSRQFLFAILDWLPIKQLLAKRKKSKLKTYLSAIENEIGNYGSTIIAWSVLKSVFKEKEDEKPGRMARLIAPAHRFA